MQSRPWSPGDEDDILLALNGIMGAGIRSLFPYIRDMAGMLPGSFVGAKLLGKLKSAWIDRIFGILMLVAGLRLVFG